MEGLAVARDDLVIYWYAVALLAVFLIGLSSYAAPGILRKWKAGHRSDALLIICQFGAVLLGMATLCNGILQSPMLFRVCVAGAVVIAGLTIFLLVSGALGPKKNAESG